VGEREIDRLFNRGGVRRTCGRRSRISGRVTSHRKEEKKYQNRAKSKKKKKITAMGACRRRGEGKCFPLCSEERRGKEVRDVSMKRIKG